MSNKRRQQPSIHGTKKEETVYYNHDLILEALKANIDLLTTPDFRVQTVNSLLDGFAPYIRVKEYSGLDKLPDNVLAKMLAISNSYLKHQVSAKIGGDAGV